MGVDTENKRRSSGQHFCLSVDPEPTGTVTGPDRAAVTRVYSGLDYGGGGEESAATTGGWQGAIIRRRRRLLP